VLTGAAAGARARHPVVEVFADRSYRSYWISVFLASLIFGGARFTWVWLVIDDPGEAALVGGIALGLPHLLFGIPAGVWADRVDRRKLVFWASLGIAALLALTAWLEHVDRMHLTVACATAAVLGTLIAIVQPTQTAMVPQLVPRRLHVTGVALQNLAFQSSFFTGSLASGAIIRAFGITSAFAAFGLMAVGSAVAILGARPTQDHGGSPSVPTGVLRATGEGLRYMFAEQPRRSLAVANIVIGLISACTAILVPKVAESVLLADALGAALLVSAMIPGMVIMTFVIASRPSLRRRGMLFFVGMAAIVPQMAIVGVSRTYWLSLVSSVVLGAPIGLFVTLVRQLTQEHTAPEMMGRAMGVLHVLSRGTLPVASLGLLLLTRFVSPSTSLLLVAAVVAVFFVGVVSNGDLRRT
jgi:predicted MFS family arabinose efflux permease